MNSCKALRAGALLMATLELKNVTALIANYDTEGQLPPVRLRAWMLGSRAAAVLAGCTRVLSPRFLDSATTSAGVSALCA